MTATNWIILCTNEISWCPYAFNGKSSVNTACWRISSWPLNECIQYHCTGDLNWQENWGLTTRNVCKHPTKYDSRHQQRIPILSPNWLHIVFLMVMNCMSLRVQLEEERNCSATVVGLDLLSGLSKVRRCSLPGLSNGLSNVVSLPLGFVYFQRYYWIM